MVIKSVNLETVCGITSSFPDNSQEKHKQSTTTILMTKSILWICQGTGMPRHRSA